MAFTSYPFENADTDESQFTLMFREFVGTGVLDSVGGSGLAVTGSAVALQTTLAAGDAMVRGFLFRNDSGYVLNHDTNSSGVTRNDRVVLRLDPSANSITPVVLKPSSGAGPVALTQTDTGIYEMLVAEVPVANAATNLAAVPVDARPFVSHRTGSWTTSTRPTSPRKFQMGHNDTTSTWEYWTGSAWADLIPTVSAVSTWTSITGTGYQLAVSVTEPVSPTSTTIWLKPIS